MAAPQTSSRLQLLQARFQQKQLQEKEQKLLQLYDQQQQRAHQVAQRGSAGSNGSNGSSHGSAIANPTGKVRQMFDERRQNNAKGIDKSYPLEPLKKQSVNGRRTALTKRNSKADVYSSSVNSSSNNRAMATSQRENVSRESYASSRTFSKDSSGQRENLSRESYASSRGESRQVEADTQFNGQANNGQHYEINIDEVIDNEAMERNRMLAKFHAVEIEKRRRFVEEFPEDLPADESSARKSSQAEARGERSKNASVKKVYASQATQPTSTRRRAEQGIPRQSTLMKTTKSASLKIRKLPKRKKTLEDKKKNSRKVEEKLKQESTKKVARVENPSSNWSDILKSTSLIYEVIRSHTKFEESSDVNKLGKVMTIVTKIEESTKENAKAAVKMNSDASTPEKENKREVKSSDDASSSEKGEDKVCQLREEKDQGDGLVSLEGNLTLTIRGNRESSVEKPTDCQEITVADQTWIKVKRENYQRAELPRPSADCANRLRRASFELKRLMFEQIQSKEHLTRRDSVESALRHFDSIGLDVTDSSLEPVPIMSGACSGEDKKAQCGECTSDAPAPLLPTNENSRPKSPPPPTRLCKDLARKDEPARGFERHTSSWSIRAAWGRQPLAQGKMLSRRKVRDAGRLKKSSSKKLFEARDSIELAQVFIKAKSPVCSRKRHLDSPAGKLPSETTTTARVKSQSTPSASEGQKVRADGKQILKNDQSLSSTPRRPGELNLKKTPPNNKASEFTSKADVSPYPSSKSPDNAREHKNRATTKSSSLKFLNQIVGSNEPVEPENGFSSVDTQDSDVSAFLENKSFEDEKALGTAGPRTASSLSSNSSIGANRQQGPGNVRQPAQNRTKSNATPTPAQRSSLSAKTDNSKDDSLTTCKICNRRFTSERIVLHEQICAKTSQKKRKQFDTVTQRVKGTELEPFVAKPTGSKKQQSKKSVEAAKPDAPKSNWRRKHEDFINAIRSAKQMQAHLAAGGKLSDLPPPPPSDTSDYIQCPHCSRKFNQTAAERHIPKCETMQHNKPRVQPRQSNNKR